MIIDKVLLLADEGNCVINCRDYENATILPSSISAWLLLLLT